MLRHRPARSGMPCPIAYARDATRCDREPAGVSSSRRIARFHDGRTLRREAAPVHVSRRPRICSIVRFLADSIPGGEVRMSMTDDQFEALVGRLDEVAKRDPSGYRRRVVALAFLGYAYLGVVLAILAVLLALAVVSVKFLKAAGVKLAFVIGAFFFLVLKALWVRLAPPGGREITRAEAPALFATIDGLRRELKAPAFHRVLITDDFNAAVVQLPRLGMLGWHRNYLLIGLPLMKALTVEQFKAVLAHELGHLSAGHGRMSNWIYRLRMSWARLMAVLEHQRSWGTFMFRRFFNWYVPYFAAYSFPLARANEYHADGVAAASTSPRALAEALTSVDVVGRFLAERYWPNVYKRADDLPQPAFAPYSGLGEQLAGGLDDASTAPWLERALADRTGTANTHPSLSDRLAAIREASRIAVPAEGASADRLLGGALAGITEDFDRRWRESVLASWEQRHREVREGRARLAELDRAAAGDKELGIDEALERARLTEAFGAGADAALEQFRAVHVRSPEAPLHAFALGVRLLARDDEAGVALVGQAIERDENFILAGSEALRDFCWRAGRTDEAKAWHTRLTERAGLLQSAQAERETIYTNDKFERHGLADDVVADLRRQLDGIPHLRKVYLVRKRVRHLAHLPLYVLGFTLTPWWRRSNKRRAAEIQQTILASVQFPGETTVLSVEGANYRFGRKFRFMRGSRIR